MGKVKIRITLHWNVPPEEGYNIGDEYAAILKPCTSQQRPDECYAVLDNGYTIPHGNFEIISGSKMPTKSFLHDIANIQYHDKASHQKTNNN